MSDPRKKPAATRAALPPVPRDASPELRRFLAALAENDQIAKGSRGNALDRALTVRDLAQLGLVSLTSGGALSVGPGAGGASPTAPGGAVEAPHAPVGVTIVADYNWVGLTWGGISYAGHLAVEIYRQRLDSADQTPDFGQAALIYSGDTSTFIDDDPYLLASMHWAYWVRNVNVNGAAGPLHEVAGQVVMRTEIGSSSETTILHPVIAAGVIKASGFNYERGSPTNNRFWVSPEGDMQAVDAEMSRVTIYDKPPTDPNRQVVFDSGSGVLVSYDTLRDTLNAPTPLLTAGYTRLGSGSDLQLGFASPVAQRVLVEIDYHGSGSAAHRVTLNGDTHKFPDHGNDDVVRTLAFSSSVPAGDSQLDIATSYVDSLHVDAVRVLPVLIGPEVISTWIDVAAINTLFAGKVFAGHVRAENIDGDINESATAPSRPVTSAGGTLYTLTVQSDPSMDKLLWFSSLVLHYDCFDDETLGAGNSPSSITAKAELDVTVELRAADDTPIQQLTFYDYDSDSDSGSDTTLYASALLRGSLVIGFDPQPIPADSGAHTFTIYAKKSRLSSANSDRWDVEVAPPVFTVGRVTDQSITVT